MVLLSLCDLFKYFMCQGLFALATRWLLRPEGKNAFRVFISKTRPLDLCYPLILLSTYLTFNIFSFSLMLLKILFALATRWLLQRNWQGRNAFCVFISKTVPFSLLLFIISFLGWVQNKNNFTD